MLVHTLLQQRLQPALLVHTNMASRTLELEEDVVRIVYMLRHLLTALAQVVVKTVAEEEGGGS